MSFGNALLYSLVGILTVFFVVAVLIFTFHSASQSGTAGAAGAAGSGAASQSGAAGAAAPAGPLAPGSAGEVKLYDTPPAVAAMLMAIVADELKTPLNELRFISIREIREEES